MIAFFLFGVTKMRSFTILSVLAFVATVNGDCILNECLEGCKDAAQSSSGKKCTMLFGYGQDDRGWFQIDSDSEGMSTCQKSCDKTCEFICDNGGIPDALSGPLKTRQDKTRFVCGGVCIGAAAAGIGNILG